MNLPPLGALITAANQARSAYTTGQQQGQQEKLKLAMQQVAMQRQEQEDALKAAFMKAQTSKLLQPPPAPRDYVGEHAANRRFDIENPLPTADRAEDLPARLQKRVQALVAGGLSLAKASEQARLEFGQQNQLPQQAPPQSITILPGANGLPPQGVVTSSRDPNRLGTTIAIPGVTKVAPGGGPGSAPMAAKVGQAGEMMKKLEDVFNASEGMEVGVGQSAARDIAEHGVGIGSVRIPGTKGIGNVMLNRTPEYAQYQAALAPFILAAAHALSGARINQDQVEQIRRSIEMQPGDFANPTVRAQKEKNLIDLVNSIVGSLPAEQMSSQEDQLSPESLTKLTTRGYRRVLRKATPPQNTVQPSQGPEGAPGTINLSDKPPASRKQALWDAAVAEYGRAVVEQKYGPRP